MVIDLDTILSGIITVITGFANIIFQFIAGILDELFFNYLPDIALILGYINGFVQTITNHLDWLLDLTGIQPSFFVIAFSLYFLRFTLIPLAYSYHFFMSLWKNYKGGS